MGNIWKALKIEPTEDVRAIKKAYAKEVKNCHQEDESERWQELYVAYQQALAYAQRKSTLHKVSYRTTNAEVEGNRKAEEKLKHDLLEQYETEQNVVGDRYTEIFDKIAVAEKEKRKYADTFPDFPKDKDYEYTDIMKKFLEKEEIQAYFGDIYFWSALEEYYSAYKSKSVAWAWVLGRQMEAIDNGRLVLNEQQKEDIRRQQQRIWAKCVEDGTFLPKKMPKQPLRAAKIDFAVAVILGLGIYAFLFGMGYILMDWLSSFRL